jgi:type I restriction enzyme S subunit
MSKKTETDTEWFQPLPKEWDTDKIISIFDFPNEKVSDEDFEPLSVSYDGVKRQMDNVAKTDNNSNRKGVRAGDIVINGRSDRKGAVGLSEHDGSVSVVYHVLRPGKREVNARYYHHLFRSSPFSEEFYKLGKGIVDDLWTTRAGEMKRMIVPVPPIEIQGEIANFLDKKTELIDELIHKKGESLQLVVEKRVALINAALEGKGWKKKRLKFLLTLVSKKAESPSDNRISLENIESWTGKWIESDSDYSTSGTQFEKGDILFGKLRPYLAKVYECPSDGEAVGDILVYRPTPEVLTRFAFYTLISDRFIDLVNSSIFGARMPRAEAFFIGNIDFAYPSLEEQKRICDSLEAEIKKLDDIAALIKPQLGRLKEYRATLVYATVTGKIKFNHG